MNRKPGGAVHGRVTAAAAKAVQRIDELTEPPRIGETYLVPCVQVKLEHSRGPCFGVRIGWWPVIEPEHEDAEFINFPHQHWHFDSRFLTVEQMRNRCQRQALHKLDFILTFPLTNHDDHIAPPVLMPRRCRREQIIWRTPLPALPRLERHLLASGHGKLKGCKVCPHRGFPLASMPVEADGGVTCPGHGLRWNAQTGDLLPRGAHKPVRVDHSLRVIRRVDGERVYYQPQAETSERWRFWGVSAEARWCQHLERVQRGGDSLEPIVGIDGMGQP